MNEPIPDFPRPHYAKLLALQANERLPESDKTHLEEAMEHYEEWIVNLNGISIRGEDTVVQLVNVTNQYKRFIELDFIFDSTSNFLYRQKGQLKIDNTILEEFLPHLVYRSLRGIDASYVLGPKGTFAGMTFGSSVGNPGIGGIPVVRKKDQDFLLGKRLYIQTSFEPDFAEAESVDTHLGYVCVECKTNLDKTMFQEAIATSRDLKMAVPSSLYFLICDYLDMTPLSIIATHIDDVLIVRKSRRMQANIRQKYSDAEARREHRDEYVHFLESSNYAPDVFIKMIDKIQAMINDTNPNVAAVLEQGYF